MVTLTDGTTVRLLKDGEALRAWYDAIAAARQSILLESYIFADDGTGRAFMNLLCRKAREGVRVYLIYDSFGSNDTPHGFFQQLRQAGGNVQEFHPLSPQRCNFSWRPFNRDHRKLIIIDGNAAGLGGLNIANEYGGSWVTDNDQAGCDDLWRDCGIGMEGPGVSALSAAFLRTWLYLTRGGRFARALLSDNLDGAQGPVGVLASVPSMGSVLSRFLAGLIRNARKSIDLTSAYFAPANDLVEELCAAARRGVLVRLMLPSRTDAHIMVTAARSFYAQLMAAGIHIYERQHVRLHAKTLVIDGAISLLGSTNFDYRSIDYNCELAVVVRSAEFGQQMVQLFEHDVEFSSCINPNVWRHRPTLDRVIQWAVNRSRYLL
jgi:cardiolipin synthase A/B